MSDGAEDAQQQGGGKANRDSNRIQVSATKKPMYFYVTLSKRLLKDHGEVQLSALGTAVSTMVSVAEILKKEGFAVEKGLSTDLEGIEEREAEGRPARPAYKPKMTVVLGKSDGFDAKMAEEAAAAKERAAARKEKAAAAAAAAGGEGGKEKEGGGGEAAAGGEGPGEEEAAAAEEAAAEGEKKPAKKEAKAAKAEEKADKGKEKGKGEEKGKPDKK